MPRRSSVSRLPPDVRNWLDKALLDRNFADYEDLAKELKTRGFLISKSSVHRHGQMFEERLAALKIATEQAKAVAEAVPDNENVMGDALIRLVQQKAFDVLVDMDDPGKVSLQGLGTMVAKLNPATVGQKKWMADVQARAKTAADAVSKVAKAGGLSDETVQAIRSQILGIAS